MSTLSREKLCEEEPISPLESPALTPGSSTNESDHARITPHIPSPTVPPRQYRGRTSTRSGRASAPSHISTRPPYDGTRKPIRFKHVAEDGTKLTTFSVISVSTTPQSSELNSPILKPQLTINVPPNAKPRDLHADLHWEVNTQNPRNWSRRRKWMHTLVPSALAFMFALGATVLAPAREEFKTDTKTSTATSVLPLSLYVLGLAFGPLLSGIASEVFGKKIVYMLSIPLYEIFMLASGLVATTSGILICRFLAGVSCSPALQLRWSTLDDVWTLEEKVLPLAICIGSVLLGSTMGPVIGGVVTYHKGWRWTQFVVVFAFAGCVLPAIAMKETSKKAVLRRKNGESARAPITAPEMVSFLSKPLRMLWREPIVALYTVHIASHVGVTYAIYTVFPSILGDAEHFDLRISGLAFISMSIGLLLGLCIIVAHEMIIYRPRVANYRDSRATEGEKTLSPAKRSSTKRNRLSFGPSSEQIRLNTARSPGGSGGRRRSIFQSLKRLSFGAAYRNLVAPDQDPRDNIRMAVAAARYLNGLKANEGRRIMPERVLLLLNRGMEYAHLCAALEGYKLKLDRAELAKVLVAALSEETKEPAVAHALAPPSSPRSIPSQDRRRDAAIAALGVEYPRLAALAPTTPPTRPYEPVTHRRKLWIPPSNIPPPEWRLWLSLPASLLTPASLFLLGWTAHDPIHYIFPIIALTLYAVSTLLVAMGLTLYIMESYGPTQSPSAVAACTVTSAIFGFAFPLVAVPIYESLGPGLATSVLALVAVLLALIPVVFYIFGPALRKRRKLKDTQ
ncbi:benomyl methotrexate resistance [Lecanosticta acicola]|uniref:Benomyl methotrexate resistance n=1 Tax=Lecanosticta acicola TaxID=111012 RepID=A0AAI8W1H0_9PEZI|nr:benomyl methotrexate resistance [Lecanosticta acicola]